MTKEKSNIKKQCIECEFHDKECTETDRKAVIEKHGKIVCANF